MKNIRLSIITSLLFLMSISIPAQASLLDRFRKNRVERNIEKALHNLKWLQEHDTANAGLLKPVVSKLKGAQKDFETYLTHLEQAEEKALEQDSDDRDDRDTPHSDEQEADNKGRLRRWLGY